MDHIKLPQPNLQKLRESFNNINSVYRSWVEVELQMQIASPPGAPLPGKPPAKPRVLIEQANMFQEVFEKLVDNEEYLQNLEWTLICYMTSLSEYEITAETFLNELFIKTLVHQLH